MAVDFWIVANNDELSEGSMNALIRIQGYSSGCEDVFDNDHLSEFVTVYDPSTAIQNENEPGKNKNNYLPLIAMGITFSGGGFAFGFILIVLPSVAYVIRRK